MAQGRILREQTVAESRYAAIGTDGRAVSLFLLRDWAPPRLMWGSVHDGRLRAVAKAQGGAFVELAGLPGAFLRLKPDHGLTEGARVHVRTVCEAHDGKLARVELTTAGDTGCDAFQSWCAGLPSFEGAGVTDVGPGDAEIEAAFDEALTPSLTLPRGGRLTIERTRALTAADIDTAGRMGRGSAGARAKAVNVEAAAALARQLELRQIGGLTVLDCIAPLTREAAGAVRTALIAAHADVSRRTAKVLAPSPLGLMELSLEWARTPLAEHYLDARGNVTPEATAIEGLRRLEREAIRAPMARLTLGLPEHAYRWMETAPVDFRSRLVARYGARLTLTAHLNDKPGIYPTP